MIQESSKVKEQIETPLRTISEEEWNEYLDYKRWKTHKPHQQQHQVMPFKPKKKGETRRSLSFNFHILNPVEKDEDE